MIIGAGILDRGFCSEQDGLLLIRLPVIVNMNLITISSVVIVKFHTTVIPLLKQQS